MSRTQFFRSLLACLSLLAAIPAGAQIFRAYLSSTGNDSNPCTLPAPCRLLPAAVNAVASGGDIWMLDPANYNTGTVTITKAVNIRSMPGVVASLVSVSGQPAVLVSAAVAVGFRGVSFGFLPGGAIGNGIQTAVDGATLVVDDCEFSGLSRGVEAGGPGTAVSITDSRFRSTGAVIYSSARATISRSHFTAGASGTAITSLMFGDGNTQVTVADSVISGGSIGLSALASFGTTSSNARLTVTGTTISGATSAALRSNGAAAFSNAFISIAGSTVSDSAAPYVITGTSGGTATITSRGNNHFNNNGAATGSLSPSGLQ